MSHDAEQYVSRAVRLANAPADRAAFSRRILAGGDRLYRNEESVCELEDFFGRVAEALD